MEDRIDERRLAHLVTGSAGAQGTTDVSALQTAAGIENLAVSAYKTALTLPFIGGAQANGVVKAFAETTLQQHQDHANAFNAAVQQLGGKPQTGTDPTYTPVVQQAVPTIKGPGDVVGLAIILEDVAAQTYVKDVSLVATSELRQLFAGIAGVEAQHKSVLLAVQALLQGGAPELIAIPVDLGKLPAGVGGVGFPESFYPTQKAAPPEEGAVR